MGHHAPGWAIWPEVGVVLVRGEGELYGFDLTTGSVRFHQVLDNDFMDLAPTPKRTRMLVLDGTSVAALDVTLRERWRTAVAVDGLILLDPPGGWETFVLDARTGAVSRPASRS